MQSYDCENLANIIPSLTKLPSSLIKLGLYGGVHYIPSSFMGKFSNLQELELSYDRFEDFSDPFEDFTELQHVTFSQLQVLKFEIACPRIELLIKFLENNGKSLKEFHVEDLDKSLNSLNLAVAKYCPNIKVLSTLIFCCELETLKEIFNTCQYLESIKVRCGDRYLNEKELFEVTAKHSPKYFCELELYYVGRNIRITSGRLRFLFYKLDEPCTTKTIFFGYY
jgi:hypothetical protein